MIKEYCGWELMASTVLALALGIAIGSGFAMHEADQVIEKQKAALDEETQEVGELEALNAKLSAALDQVTTAGGTLLQRVNQDENSGDATVIYEKAPQIQLQFTGIHGLPFLPLPGHGQQLPRVLIPGRVHPLILAPDGDAREAVFYYLDKANQLTGPFMPEVVKPQ